MKPMTGLIAALAMTILAGCSTPTDAGGSPPPRHGKTCAGIAGLQCGAGDGCVIPQGRCRMPDAGGICKTRPQMCPHLVKPVCGCDSKTYNNACEAQRAGASILHDGACEAPPRP